MIKRTVTIFFIVLANIILLAHAAIPHHHHKSDICIVNNHKHADNVAHDNCTAPNHGHENNGDDCELNQVVVIRSHQIIYEIKCFDYDDNQSQFDGLQSVLVNKSFDDLFSLNTSNAKPPLLRSIYSFNAGTSIGLRAPPTV